MPERNISDNKQERLILVHAEDQLMSAESFKIIAEEMIASYERIIELEKKLENK